MKYTRGVATVPLERTGATILVLLCILWLTPINGQTRSLQPLDNDDLRDVSAEEGLRQGFSLESLDRTGPSARGYPPLHAPVLASDTSLIGDFLLRDFYRATSDYLLPASEEETFPRYVFEFTRQPLFQSDPLAAVDSSFFSNSGIDLTTGPVPESTQSAHDL